MANSVDPDQTAPTGAVCSGSTLFPPLLNLSVMLGNYLQQMTTAGYISNRFFSWRFNSFIASSDFKHLLTAFTNSLGSDQDR